MAMEIVSSMLMGEYVLAENSDKARALYDQSRFGAMLKSGRIQLSLLESVYLVQKEKLRVMDKRNRELTEELLVRKASKQDRDFSVRFPVFANLRDRGYIVKTALKFGADFRVYDKGIKPGEDHARWIVFPVHESSQLKWSEFSAKNRVAHSTKKKLLIGVVDDEDDVSYWEINWLKP